MSVYFLISVVPDLQNVFDVYVPKNQYGFLLLGKVVDLIDSLIEEWYPGISDSSRSSGSVLRLAPCVECRQNESGHYFTVAECTKASYKSDSVECPNCGMRLIREVAPDVVFADIDESLVVEQINIDDSLIRAKEKRIGDGAFSTVYKINVEGENLAAKVNNLVIFLKLFLKIVSIHQVFYKDNLKKLLLMLTLFIFSAGVYYERWNQPKQITSSRS